MRQQHNELFIFCLFICATNLCHVACCIICVDVDFFLTSPTPSDLSLSLCVRVLVMFLFICSLVCFFKPLDVDAFVSLWKRLDTKLFFPCVCVCVHVFVFFIYFGLFVIMFEYRLKSKKLNTFSNPIIKYVMNWKLFRPINIAQVIQLGVSCCVNTKHSYYLQQKLVQKLAKFLQTPFTPLLK